LTNDLRLDHSNHSPIRWLSEGIELDFSVLKVDMSELIFSFRDILIVLSTADGQRLECLQQVLWNWLVCFEIIAGLSKGLDEFWISIDPVVCSCIMGARTKGMGLRQLGVMSCARCGNSALQLRFATPPASISNIKRAVSLHRKSIGSITGELPRRVVLAAEHDLNARRIYWSSRRLNPENQHC
jgi:hypothetical protein